MKGSLYRDRDYAFGQTFLTLRSKIGLTQVELAARLRVSRKAVGEWEAGETYPTVEHLKAVITLAIEHLAWPLGREAEEVRALWHAAHQKMPLDEAWLGTLLPHTEASPASEPGEQTSGAARAPARPVGSGPRLEWGDALAVTSFYGRKWELDLLSQWVVEERCRVVSVLGQGGIGKSALATKVMQRVAERFEVIIWRSLRDVPSCEALLDDCLQVLAPQALRDVSASLESRQSLLVECLRSSRVLLVYDNVESFLVEGEGTGRMRPGYEGFARVLRRVAETEHQSCWLLTSREKPSELVPLEGSRAPVRALRIARLDDDSCQQLLAEKEVTGSAADQAQLIEMYVGNPLALKIVARTIVELFDSQIAPFLEQGEVVFGGVRELLDEQYARLSTVEQSVLRWLAIVREPVSLEELHALLVTRLAPAALLEAVEALHRRSLLERGQRPGRFTLQSVVLEYVTSRLIAEVAREIEQGELALLIEHGLELAHARDYVRQAQVRLIVAPLLAQVQGVYRGQAEVEEHLLALLDQLRAQANRAQGYGPANVLALLREQCGHLRGLDLSQLVIRGASLQGVEIQDTSLAGAVLRGTTFTEVLDAIRAVAISRDGQYWAATSKRGEVRVWQEEGQKLHLALQAGGSAIPALAFSPDQRTLATGSWSGSVELWDVESGALLWTGWHTNSVQCLAFAPNGRVLASSGDDAIIQLWDTLSGKHLQTLTGHSGQIFSVAWSPDGRFLASAGFDTHIRLWEFGDAQPNASVRMLSGHTDWVSTLAFAPDGRTLASGSWDQTVKLWDVEGQRMRETLTGHNGRVNAVAWSRDGNILASCSLDRTIWLWHLERGSSWTVLHGHMAAVNDLAFTSDNRSLLSGGEDCTLRVWNVESEQCVRIMQNYAVSLYDVAWSPDGKSIASAGSDMLVTLWNLADRVPRRLLRGHSGIAYAVAWSPNGRQLVSCGGDNAIRVWNPDTGTVLQIFRDSDHLDTVFYSVAWSPDGKFLASGSFRQGIYLWDMATGTRRWVSSEQPTRIRRVAWSPDGMQLASCGFDDSSIFLWEASHGTVLAKLQGHRGIVMSVAWSPDGALLATGGGARGNGELFVWDARSGERLHALSEPSKVVYVTTWSPTRAVLLSGGSDGSISWWETQNWKCLARRQGHQGAVQSLSISSDGRLLVSCSDDNTIQVWDIENCEHLRTLRRDRPYERLNISGVKGLTQAQKVSLRALGAIESAPVLDIRDSV